MQLRKDRSHGTTPAGGHCAWRLCRERADFPLPKGWWNLFCYESPEPILDVMFNPKHFHRHRRDAVLCPKHATILEDLLWPLPKGAKGGDVVVVPDKAR
jgi:hypothetical protein